MKLVSRDGTRDYALVFGSNLKDRLPKKPASTMPVVIDGVEIDAPVTVNKGWAGSAPCLVYPWFLIGGKPYYATLNPGETLDGDWTIADGVATRKDPKRETTKVETEAGRIAKFRATYAARTVKPVEVAPAPTEPAASAKKKVKSK